MLQIGETYCFGDAEKLQSIESCQQFLSTLATIQGAKALFFVVCIS
jgi:hypothetical protein